MNLSNIMVSVDLGSTAADRVRLAAGIAQSFGARLTGVAALQAPRLIGLDDPLELEGLFEGQDRRANERLAEAKSLFLRCAGPAVQTAWRSAQADPSAHLVEQARVADLLVVGRYEAADGHPDPMSVSAGPLLMEAGVPVLLAPPRAAIPPACRVVVAWSDTPEARRAIRDALPFLVVAEQAHVVAMGHTTSLRSAQDVAEFLNGHRVRVKIHLLPDPEPGFASALVRFAHDEEAGLIVMGAYGHSRLREWILGGVTRDMLREAPVCCLMSH